MQDALAAQIAEKQRKKDAEKEKEARALARDEDRVRQEIRQANEQFEAQGAGTTGGFAATVTSGIGRKTAYQANEHQWNIIGSNAGVANKTTY